MREIKPWSLTEIHTMNARVGINDLVNEAYDNACDHGFHEAHERLMGAAFLTAIEEEAGRTIMLEMLAKIGSEVGEAVSAIQHGDNAEMYEELADIVIRAFDMAGYLNIDLGSRIIDKMQRNRLRPYLHGKKC